MPKPKGAIRHVLLLGGAGYLGSVLTRQLLEVGYHVRVLDNLLFGDMGLVDPPGQDRLEVRRVDVRDLQAVSDALEGMDAAILLAALVGASACDRDPRETVDINLVATLAVAHAARAHGLSRFLYASTDSAYGIQEGTMVEGSPLNPISLYAKLKAEAEEEILRLRRPGFAPCVLRMATLYGYSPRMRFDLVLNVLVRNATVHNKVTIYGGAQWRPFVHVADVAAAYRLALEAPAAVVDGQIFNVGSNEQNYRIGELGDLIRKVFPHVEVETVPQTPDLRDYHVCFDKIDDALGYRVRYAVEDGIREMRDAITSGRIADPFDRRYVNA